ncbi:MAG: MMPL family transporter [Planctomycetes bacterium]|nr:MMPL family transporter [Planctomycetota bacterium]
MAGLAIGVLLLCLVTLAPAPRVDNASTTWFPGEDVRLEVFHGFQQEFGADAALVVELEGSDLTRLVIRAGLLEEELAQIPGVARVVGPKSAFATELQILADPELAKDGLRFVGWAFKGPLNRSLKLLEPELRKARIVVLVDPGQATTQARLLECIDEHREAAGLVGVHLRAAGQPLVNLELDRAAELVERESMPWLVVACATLLLVLTRSLRRTLALLAPVGLCVLALDGVLGLSGVTTNLIVAITKPLAFVILLASGYHVLVSYDDERRSGLDGWEAARGAVRDKAPALCLALFTTAIGFGTLATSSVRPIQTFGWLSALALVGLGLPALLLLLPLLLALSGPPSSVQPSRVGEFVARLTAWSARHWLPVCLLGAALVAGGALGATRLRAQPHAIRYLAPDHPLRVQHQELEASGVPLAQIELVVRGPEPLVEDADLLARIDTWSRGLAELPGVRAQVSLTLLLREVGYRTARVDSIPAAFLLEEILERRRADFSPYLADGGRALRISLAIDTLDTEQLDRLRAGVEASFEDQLGGSGLELATTGSYDLLLRTQDSLLQTMQSSLLLTALLMQSVLLVFLRSVRIGLASLLPNALPVALLLAILGLGGVPVDVGTAMTAAIALGIAVDDTLHFLWAWRKQGLDGAARGTARAILLSSLVITAGFLAISPSPFLPTRNFGLLCAAAMLGALVGDLVLLPACLRAFGCRPARREVVQERPSASGLSSGLGRSVDPG